MMKFRTEIPVPKYPFEIGLDSQILFLGSCFSEPVSAYFIERDFKALANPFGILFNPLSIAFALDLMTGKQHLSERYFSFFEEKWISFAHHGKFSNPDRTMFEEGVKDSLEIGSDFLQNADFLFVTLGTSYYYFHKEKELVVANCHKVPGTEFDKRRASVTDVCNAFLPFFEWRNLHRPDLRVIFTVSPVRHLGDGFHENQLSKSILHLSIEKMQETHENVFYFPSYEIFMDDLRDYRFYDKDLCHPSQQGVEYVREMVASAFFTDSARQKITEIERELRRNGHRPLL